MDEPEQPAPFAGIRVLELAQWVFVPVAGALLADWGADVVRIEHPTTGDPYRGLVSQGILRAHNGVNMSYELANRGKRAIALDVQSEAGREVVYRLAEDVDVFLTNFRPATLERLGFGASELRRRNERLIYARGHGVGIRGPDADIQGYDASSFWARGA